MQRVMPYVLYEDVPAALDWLTAAFGFKEWLRYADDDGRVSHSEMRVGDDSILLGGPDDYESPRRHGHVCQYVVVAVDDVEGHLKRAKKAGAEIVSELKTQPWGDMEYRAKDPEGHVWFFEQHLRVVSPEDWGAVRKAKGKPLAAGRGKTRGPGGRRPKRTNLGASWNLNPIGEGSLPPSGRIAS
jgi:uncharacterized glyoxalase superfamily protein PhnB